MGFVNRVKELAFLEENWKKRKPVGTDIYEALRQKAGKVRWGKEGRRELPL